MNSLLDLVTGRITDGIRPEAFQNFPKEEKEEKKKREEEKKKREQ